MSAHEFLPDFQDGTPNCRVCGKSLEGHESIVERVARHMAERSNGGSWNNPDDFADEHKVTWRLRARFAFEAMREPTDAMCADGAESADNLSHRGAMVVWQAMIDTVLSEQSNR